MDIEKRAQAVQGDSGTLSNVCVLIVDDDSDTRDLFAMAFTQEGADVLVAASTADAMSLMREASPDVLISDIKMPGEDGYELLRQVSQLDNTMGRQTPVIAVTAVAGHEERKQMLAQGFRSHLAKPVDLEELIAVVVRIAQHQN